MTDIFSKEKRSEIMSRIRSKNTEAEKIVFTFLRKEGIYFQKHYRKISGSPDIALPRKKRAVFIDGDFWHGRNFERIKKGWDENDYWFKKIGSNIKRDRKQRRAMKKEGWVVLKIWESNLKRKSSRPKQLEKIKNFLAE
ncbi:MAG TPA: very short patch repair endonuclease [Smithella sp.]|nr:very short patch repair endonuclease [Smithella sp.]